MSKKWQRENPEKMRRFRREWYYRNRDDQVALAVKRNKARKKLLRVWMTGLKAGLKCERCDENHPATLDFHHRDPKTKEFRVGQMYNGGWSMNRILLEIAKCEVLCANCHRKEHYKVG